MPNSQDISRWRIIDKQLNSQKIITGKWERLFEFAPSNVTRGHGYKLFKKTKGTLGHTLFFGARVVDLRRERNDSTVAADIATALRESKEFKDPLVVCSVLTQASELLRTIGML